MNKHSSILMINTDCLKLFEKANPPQAKIYWQVWNQTWYKIGNQVWSIVWINVHKHLRNKVFK